MSRNSRFPLPSVSKLEASVIGAIDVYFKNYEHLGGYTAAPVPAAVGDVDGTSSSVSTVDPAPPPAASTTAPPSATTSASGGDFAHVDPATPAYSATTGNSGSDSGATGNWGGNGSTGAGAVPAAVGDVDGTASGSYDSSGTGGVPEPVGAAVSSEPDPDAAVTGNWAATPPSSSTPFDLKPLLTAKVLTVSIRR